MGEWNFNNTEPPLTTSLVKPGNVGGASIGKQSVMCKVVSVKFKSMTPTSVHQEASDTATTSTAYMVYGSNPPIQNVFAPFIQVFESVGSCIRYLSTYGTTLSFFFASLVPSFPLSEVALEGDARIRYCISFLPPLSCGSFQETCNAPPVRWPISKAKTPEGCVGFLVLTINDFDSAPVVGFE